VVEVCCVGESWGEGRDPAPRPCAAGFRSVDPPALNKPNKNDDDRNAKEDVDEASHGVRRDQPQQPEEEENNCDDFEPNIIGLKVVKLFLFERLCFSPGLVTSMRSAQARGKANHHAQHATEEQPDGFIGRGAGEKA
jgi:hypothetical protein